MKSAKPAAGNAPAVGRMAIKLEPLRNQWTRGAHVSLTIDRRPQSERLNGIAVKETLPGWLSLDLSPLESLEVYELLESEVTRCCLVRSRSLG